MQPPFCPPMPDGCDYWGGLILRLFDLQEGALGLWSSRTEPSSWAFQRRQLFLLGWPWSWEFFSRLGRIFSHSRSHCEWSLLWNCWNLNSIKTILILILVAVPWLAEKNHISFLGPSNMGKWTESTFHCEELRKNSVEEKFFWVFFLLMKEREERGRQRQR